MNLLPKKNRRWNNSTMARPQHFYFFWRKCVLSKLMKKVSEGTISLLSEDAAPLILCGSTYLHVQFSLFSHSVVSDSLRPYESQHARPPCPSPTTGVHPNSSASSQWCHPAISFSVVPLSSCPQSLPVSRSFPMSQLFAWNGQSIGVSALASAICM